MTLTENDIKAIEKEAKVFAEKHYVFTDDFTSYDKGMYSAYIIAAQKYTERERMKARGLSEVLNKCKEYFDNKADADYVGEEIGYTPNKEMQILVEIDQTLAEYNKTQP